MSLRLSALFEEHVGPILADYRAIHGLTDKLSRQSTDRQTRHTTDRQTRHAMKRRRRRSESPASSTASRYRALNPWFSNSSCRHSCVMVSYMFSRCSPERKRRMSSRVMTKREPSPAPSRPPSLRQSVPTKQAPQLVNGKAEAPAGGRTRSAARSSTHTPPVATSTQSATNNAQNTAGSAMCACTAMLTATIRELEEITLEFCCCSESTRLLRGHSSSLTPPVPEKVTPSPTMESNSGGSTRRKLKPPVRHSSGKGLCHED